MNSFTSSSNSVAASGAANSLSIEGRTLNLRGAAGAISAFKIRAEISEFSPIEDLPPSSSGVYALLDADGTPLYIGQSGLIQSRVATHRREKSWFSKVDRIVAFRLADTDARLELETRLILDHRPRHNRWIRLNLRKDGSLYETQFLDSTIRKRRSQRNA